MSAGLVDGFGDRIPPSFPKRRTDTLVDEDSAFDPLDADFKRVATRNRSVTVATAINRYSLCDAFVQLASLRTNLNINIPLYARVAMLFFVPLGCLWMFCGIAGLTATPTTDPANAEIVGAVAYFFSFSYDLSTWIMTFMYQILNLGLLSTVYRATGSVSLSSSASSSPLDALPPWIITTCFAFGLLNLITLIVADSLQFALNQRWWAGFTLLAFSASLALLLVVRELLRRMRFI
jgi:hypothetical protein